MQLAYQVNLFIHAVAGLVALAVLPVPLIAKKGRKTHRVVGWVFTVAMAIVALTGLGLALAWLIDPLQFKPAPAHASTEQLAAVVRSYRAFGLFFVAIAMLAGSAVWYGITSVPLARARRVRGRWSMVLDHGFYSASLATGATLLIVGLSAVQPLFIAFGLLAIISAIEDARCVRRPPTEPKAWLIRHLQAMLGGATAAITAFSALTLRRYMPESSGFEIGYWLIPVALGTTATIVWTRKVRATMGQR